MFNIFKKNKTQHRSYGANFVPPTSALPPDDPPPQPLFVDGNVEYTSLETIDSLKIMTKDEFMLYYSTGKWEGNSKEHVLKMFEEASEGHKFVFYMHSTDHTYSVDYIDKLLKRG